MVPNWGEGWGGWGAEQEGDVMLSGNEKFYQNFFIISFRLSFALITLE